MGASSHKYNPVYSCCADMFCVSYKQKHTFVYYIYLCITVTDCHSQTQNANHEVFVSWYADKCENLTTSNIALTRKDKHAWEKHSNSANCMIISQERQSFVVLCSAWNTFFFLQKYCFNWAWCCCHASEHTVFLWQKTWSCLRTYDLNLQLYLLNMIVVVLNVLYSKPSLYSNYFTYILIVLMHSERPRCWN